ncbi:MAG: diaminopimelate epimerase [Steroidobacteraceae bacterium]
MRLNFTKMHGLGNDFIVFDARQDELPAAAALRRLADRHRGVGFDQALVLEPPRQPGTSVFYRIFNADGVEVEQCGNGARCIAALLHRRGLARQGETLLMDSPAGTVRARVLAPQSISVEMGVPSFDPRSLPFDAPQDAPAHELEVAGGVVQIGAVCIGNPHAVLTVGAVDAAPVERLGPAIESHPRFPKRVNVGFMEIVDRGRIRLRVYERGAGETLACGTGACAAVAVGRRRGLLDREVSVHARGGELRVNWHAPGDPVWLTGPAEVAFEGHVDL